MGCCSAVARIIQRSLSPERNSARSRQHDTSPNTTLRAIHPYRTCYKHTTCICMLVTYLGLVRARYSYSVHSQAIKLIH